MDPDANSLEQWEIVKAFENRPSLQGTPEGASMVARYLELRGALRAWRGIGGFTPETAPPTYAFAARTFGKSFVINA